MASFVLTFMPSSLLKDERRNDSIIKIEDGRIYMSMWPNKYTLFILTHIYLDSLLNLKA